MPTWEKLTYTIIPILALYSLIFTHSQLDAVGLFCLGFVIAVARRHNDSARTETITSAEWDELD